jgi:biotin/methionine sulfoxide reductase
MATAHTLFHWGLYEARPHESGEPGLARWRGDEDPSPIGLADRLSDFDVARVARPSVRRSVLEQGPGARRDLRGREAFVEVDWPTAIKLVASELTRVIDEHGNASIFGGSYGWASAGRFHHALSQLHRFLNVIGGYIRQTDSYSLGAGRVLMPHLLGTMDEIMGGMTSWDVMERHTELFVTFGGVPAKNAQVSPGGAGSHRVAGALRRMKANGARFVNFSPVQSNLDVGGEVEWIPIRPNTDTALMLGLAFVLQTEGFTDRAQIDRYASGFGTFLPYLLGETDGVPKTPEWAAAITGMPEETIRRVARDMASSRTMLNIAWALQRASHGEQPFWMLMTLGCMLGQFGLPGGGFGLGYGAMNGIGSPHVKLKGPTFPQGRNPIDAFIPCARVTDMLLSPGERFAYNGGVHTYPDARLIYWAGGNPFHHHQDLNRLVAAWQRPETIIVHEPYWTPTAKHADIVLPVTTSVEREDIGFSTREGTIVAMRKLKPAYGEARSDFDILAAVAARMGLEAAFTEGLDEDGWLRRLYGEFRRDSSALLPDLPDFDAFLEAGVVPLPRHDEGVVYLQDYRRDPEAHPLPTPSGKMEIHSERIAAFGLADCQGHPRWYEPAEWLGSARAKTYPLHMISDQPERRLHSQLDTAPWSKAGKVDGREPIQIRTEDALARGIVSDDIVRVFNDRGACLASAVVSDAIGPHVVKLSTGAWFDQPGSIEQAGNPNVLTLDIGASGLSQGCTAQTCLVEIEKYAGAPTRVTAHDLPHLIAAATGLRPATHGDPKK